MSMPEAAMKQADYSTGLAGGSPTVTQSPLSEAQRQVEMALEQLSVSISQHEDRLDSVLRPRYDSAEAAHDPGLAPVGSRVMFWTLEQAERIERLAATVRAITERVDCW